MTDLDPVLHVDLRSQAEEHLQELVLLITEGIKSGVYVGGDAVERFEARTASLCGTRAAIAVNSGTDALILALRVAGVGPGDEVVTAPNSFIATAAAIAHVGARPVFADVLPDQNIDPEAVAQAITPRTRALLPVHLTGRVCHMDRLMSLAAAHGLALIEDAAQAVGSRLDGRPSGSFGHFGCFSAHPLKNLNAMGDAGFITTNDTAAAERLRRLRNHGLRDRGTADEWGYVSRMDTLQALVLSYRLEHLDNVIARRRANVARYRARLAAAPEVFIPPCRPVEFNTFHTLVAQCERRDGLRDHLTRRGVRTAIHYPVPIHLQPAATYLGYGLGSFPVTETQARCILTLPVHQYLTPDDIDRVCDAILAFYREPS